MQSEWRLSFHELLQGEEDGAILGLASHLARDGLEQAARFAQTEALFESPPPLAGPFFGYFDPLRERMEVGSIDAPGFRYLIRQYAPVALTYGSWVAPLAGTATVHRRPFALLFRYHADGGARRVRDGYRRLLAGQGIGLPEIVDETFIAMALCSMRPSCRRFSRSASHDRPRACFPSSSECSWARPLGSCPSGR